MEKKRRGRPSKKGRPGERYPLSFRVTCETKNMLRDSALASGRSISQEAELRIEMAYWVEKMAPGAFLKWLTEKTENDRFGDA